MRGHSPDVEIYGAKYLVKKLEGDFGSKLHVVKSKNRFQDTVLYFNDGVESILRKFYQEEKAQNVMDQKKRVIKLAADLIKSEINDIPQVKGEYFCFNDMEKESCLNFIPETLLLLLNALSARKSEVKDRTLVHAALGQAIVQMSRPRTITAPMQLALAVEIHHKTGSRFLVDVLHKFGFCSDYNTCQRFQRDAIFHNMSSEIGSSVTPLYVGDNADVNQRSIDGKNTHHMMGMIKCSPAIRASQMADNVKIKDISATNEQIRAKAVPIRYVRKVEKSSITVLLKGLATFSSSIGIFKSVSNLDFLRISARLVRPVPEFTGMMKLLTRRNSHQGCHKIDFLPFIDMNPSDTSTVFTTLSFISDMCDREKTKCVLTFDQPLWLTAMILKSEYKMNEIFLLLGNFHTQMAFHATIGYLMKNTGLKEMMSCVYASLSVDGILKGKSFERAVRAHDLVSTVLKSIVLKQV